MNIKIFKRVAAVTAAALMTVSAVYADSEPSWWAQTDVNEAIESGIVPDDLQTGYTESLSRAGFTHLAIAYLAKLQGLTPDKLEDGGTPFSDTNDPYVTAAYNRGIINGRGDGSFAPDNSITRQEAAKILINTQAAYLGKTPTGTGELISYTDNASIADWAREYVELATRMQIMKGMEDGSFSPDGTYTTEQAIITFIRLFRNINSDETKDPTWDNENPPIIGILKVIDGELNNGSENITLNGVNIGNWLLVETWLSPISDPNESMANSDIIRILTDRFGEAAADEIIEKYQDSYITEADFERIARLGFNCVRIPFWYRNFMSEDGEWLSDNPDEIQGFRRLDWALDQCKKYGIYAVLDMHGCPGGQSLNHSTGTNGSNTLYTNRDNQKMMEKLWTTIADRYKDNPCIAAYDIMNEPHNNGGNNSPKAWKPEGPQAVSLTNSVYDTMIKAIRRVDQNHVITVEGIWSMKVLPNPVDYGWTNMMYQLHIYDDNEYMINERIKELRSAQKEYGVAVYVGEYNSRSRERFAAGRYSTEKINRSKWNYKGVCAGFDGWSLFNKNLDTRADITSESAENLMKLLGDDMLTENGFYFDTREYNKIKE